MTCPIFGRTNRIAWMALLAACLLMAEAGRGYAHRVIIFAWIDGDTIHTQSKFPGDRPVSQGEIAVCDDRGRVLFQGTTDPEGKFSFGLDQAIGAETLEIKLVAGMGHQASWTLTAEEMTAARGDKAGGEVQRPSAKTKIPPAPSSRTIPAPGGSAVPMAFPQEPCLNESDVQRIVEAALDRKMSPVMDMLVTIQEKMAVGLDDVMAGIGYIFGLAGVAAYAYSRGKKE